MPWSLRLPLSLAWRRLQEGLLLLLLLLLSLLSPVLSAVPFFVAGLRKVPLSPLLPAS